jgi:hypothetical protein
MSTADRRGQPTVGNARADHTPEVGSLDVATAWFLEACPSGRHPGAAARLQRQPAAGKDNGAIPEACTSYLRKRGGFQVAQLDPSALAPTRGVEPLLHIDPVGLDMSLATDRV